ncbi:hypothetical protein H8N03_24625 [Ramlibacter sp. USB13]|uniref:Uncharacterized protein n=1 Tax=Ramlibacter cellulosilyticus TaxID=2764187 RepID=A0A923SHQ6_9BURK|nr:hypothetical protein [Ramlibacter cellulosilyticus]MBC5786147.1 hypothetical protein [Ramlibacter cellulosilyticus]
MGFSFSWVAVHGKSAEEVLHSVGLVDTGEVASPGATAYAGAVLPGGWYLIWLKEFNHEWTEQLLAESISSECLAVGCTASESVNASRSVFCRDIEMVWEVSHVLDEGEDDLAVEGDPPDSLPAILAGARQRAAQARCDAVFDVPITLAHEICGFRHDAHAGLRFTVLAPTDKLLRSPFA